MSAPDARRLALFDLDHTLVPFDTGMAWTRHLVASGALPVDVEDDHLGHCRAHVEGRIDIRGLCRFGLSLLAIFEPAELYTLRRAQQAAIAESVPPAARQLVRRHLDRGDLCVMVTATVRFIAEPYAEALGIPHLLATESMTYTDSRGQVRHSGDLGGTPCWGPEKPACVGRWLRQQRLRWEDFHAVTAYSDAISDLPMLGHATHPVAVRPDPRLREHAVHRGWSVVDGLDKVATLPGD